MENTPVSHSMADLMCQMCQKILRKPVLLSCECKTNICKEHLNGLFANNVQESLFECKKCKAKLNLLKQDLKENSQLNLDLESFKYLSHKKQELKSKLESKLDEIEKLFVNVKEVRIGEYSERIYDHFYSLRNEIDIERETVLEQLYKGDDGGEEKNREEIEEINRQSSNLMEQIDSTENEFRRKLMDEITSILINEINIAETRKHLAEILRSTFLKVRDIKKLLNETESKITQIQSEFDQIERQVSARLRANKFRKTNQSLVEGTNQCNNFIPSFV